MRQSSQIAWFEIATKDIERAIYFYESVFEIKFTREQMGSTTMAVFPYQEGQAGGALIFTDNFKSQPSGNNTTIIYLTVPSIAEASARVEKFKGKVILSCTSIGENGYIATMKDTEQNTIGLWSMTS